MLIEITPPTGTRYVADVSSSVAAELAHRNTVRPLAMAVLEAAQPTDTELSETVAALDAWLQTECESGAIDTGNPPSAHALAARWKVYSRKAIRAHEELVAARYEQEQFRFQMTLNPLTMAAHVHAIHVIQEVFSAAGEPTECLSAARARAMTRAAAEKKS